MKQWKIYIESLMIDFVLKQIWYDIMQLSYCFIYSIGSTFSGTHCIIEL